MRIIFTLLIISQLAAADLHACGYSFVGGCSSHIRLKINGTEDEFAIASCDYETVFQGLQLGNLRSLTLSGGSVITWESCINHVSAAALYYRVYPTGQGGGNWSNVTIPEDYNTIQGPYTTRYRDLSSNINLASGLNIGTNYTLEIYVRADVDTLGNDFIPETFMLANNDGSNYKLTFTYGGPNAPALTTVVTHKEPVLCWGKKTGKLGVEVYGGQAGGTFFYQWSANTQNFYQIDSLAAGIYTVTVTESPSGFTSTRSGQITQPALPISLSFSGVTPASCGAAGMATVNASGGTGALSWEWSTGDTLATAQFPVSGIYAITITDANACTQKGMVTIGGTGTATVFELHAICSGETFVRGNQSFTQSGLHSVAIPGPNGCDSIIDFYLTVVDGVDLLASVPTQTTVTCAIPLQVVCAGTGANTYAWTRNDQPVGNGTACLDIIAGGNYTINLTNTTDGKTCTFTKAINVAEHLEAGTLQASGTGLYTGACYTGGLGVKAIASASEQISTYTWTYNNAIVSLADTCTYIIPNPNNGLGTLNLKTIDQYGCQKELQNIIITAQQPQPQPVIFGALQQTNCDGTISVNLNVAGGAQPVAVHWSSGVTGNPVDLLPGFNNVEAIDAAGCITSVFVIVEDFSIEMQSSPTSGIAAADGNATVLVKGAINLPYTTLWNTGATTTTITNLNPGTYCATVTDESGCTRTACTEVLNTSGVTQPFGQVKGLAIYPNPATVGTEVQITPVVEKALWKLVDLNGRTLDEQWIKLGQSTLRLPDYLPEGIYTVVVQSNNFLQWDKIFLKNGR